MFNRGVPKPLQFESSERRVPLWFWLLCVVVGILIFGQVLKFVNRATTDERADFVGQVTDEGLSRDDAECVADGLEDRYGGVEDVPASEEALRAMLSLLRGCRAGYSGAPDAVSSCVVDALTDRLSDRIKFDTDSIFDAASNMDADDRRFLTESGFICQGAPETVAHCIVETLAVEYGPALFETESLALTTRQQERLVEISAGCQTDA